MAKKERSKGEITPVGHIRPLSMMRDFDKMFDEFRTGFEDRFWGPFHDVKLPSLDIREPLVDLADLGDKFELSAEIPGIPKDKIEVQVSGDSIEIKAEVEEKKEEKEKEYVCKERSYQSFYRKMTLPDEIVPDKANAEVVNGTLKITLPKKEPKEVPKTKKLRVK